MRSARPSAVAGILLAVCLCAAPLLAATTVARVTLQAPATPGHEAVTVDVVSYSLDSVADFSLVRAVSTTTRTGLTRATVVLPAATSDITFATSGSASRFSLLTIRQADAAGVTLHRTVFHDVRVLRVERVMSGADAQRRITFTAKRIEDGPGRGPG